MSTASEFAPSRARRCRRELGHGASEAIDRVLNRGGDADDERALLERVATLVSPSALVGWDTGGEEWAP